MSVDTENLVGWLTWDWREQISLADVNEAISQGARVFVEVETGSDMHAAAGLRELVSDDEANRLWQDADDVRMSEPPISRSHRFAIGDTLKHVDASDGWMSVEALTWREHRGERHPTYTLRGRTVGRPGGDVWGSVENVLDTDDLVKVEAS